MENNQKKESIFGDLFSVVWTVPNVLTFIRIILIPLFAWLFYTSTVENHRMWWALGILAASGLTDFLDGKIARRFNQVSPLGKVLDPVADKLTQITLAVIMFLEFLHAESAAMHAFSWVFLLFIAKELVMVIGGAVMISKGLRPGAAEIYGKAATFAFYAVMIILMAFGPEVGVVSRYYPNVVIPEWLAMTLVVIAAVMTFVAFASYMPETYRQFKGYWAKKDAEKNKNK